MPTPSQHSKDLKAYIEILCRQLADAGIEPAPFVQAEPLVIAGRLREPLTRRELDVIELVAEGLTNREAADRLFVSFETVKTHRQAAYKKLGLNSRSAVVRWYFTASHGEAARASLPPGYGSGTNPRSVLTRHAPTRGSAQGPGDAVELDLNMESDPPPRTALDWISEEACGAVKAVQPPWPGVARRKFT